MRNTILVGDVREQLARLPDESVHCVVTSPPYWGLRDYGTAGQLGLEATPEEYVANMVAVFREVRRVLRRDGTCWVNLGDSYAQGGFSEPSPSSGLNGGRGVGPTEKLRNAGSVVRERPPGLKPKDLCGIPWRVAFALQADGWWLRSDIIWSKPNPMPESVTDRPTKAHEYLFLLTKSERYFYDAEAVKEPAQYGRREGGFRGDGGRYVNNAGFENSAEYRPSNTVGGKNDDPSAGRNRRTVWEIATEPYAEAHFATFPTELVKPCILAGTSEWGCCSVCGAPWERVVERGLTDHDGETETAYAATATAGRLAMLRQAARALGGEYVNETRTTGWRPTCKHEAPLERCIVLDPFLGSGTTALVAKTAGRDWLGIELNPTYAEMAKRRINVDQERLL